ncbi:MAG: DUF3379 family protein [Gammaproteobacteria bacterium]|jgi:hypothetical protein
MNCETFRKQICINPADSDPGMLAHLRECTACAAYAQRAHTAQALIHQALRFDVSKALEQPSQRTAAFGSFAAAAVVGLAVWLGLVLERPAATEELVAEIIAHMDHEPEAITVTSVGVAERELGNVLAGDATIDLTRLGARVGPVTYANKCAVAGQWMAHLVVQSGNGPVTVLLIPEQGVAGIVPLELTERGLGGSIMPAGGGSIAVLGENDAANAQIAGQVVEAVNISI